jgi:hypothetical protein
VSAVEACRVCGTHLSYLSSVSLGFDTCCACRRREGVQPDDLALALARLRRIARCGLPAPSASEWDATDPPLPSHALRARTGETWRGLLAACGFEGHAQRPPTGVAVPGVPTEPVCREIAAAAERRGVSDAQLAAQVAHATGDQPVKVRKRWSQWRHADRASRVHVERDLAALRALPPIHPYELQALIAEEGHDDT